MDQCRNITGLDCCRDDGHCPGHADQGVCQFTKALTRWTNKSDDQQAQYYATAPATSSATSTTSTAVVVVRDLPAVLNPVVVAAWRSCPNFGSALTAAELAACGCGNRELYHCRAGVVGETGVAGRVTTRNCYWCRATALGVAG